ncbi:hypothetical protein GOODEAATRI_020531, partial [Goodea atripinnis]
MVSSPVLAAAADSNLHPRSHASSAVTAQVDQAPDPLMPRPHRRGLTPRVLAPGAGQDVLSAFHVFYLPEVERLVPRRCHGMTRHATGAIFHNIDVSTYNAFVLWRETNPRWMSQARHRRRLFLEHLSRVLVALLVEHR